MQIRRIFMHSPRISNGDGGLGIAWDSIAHYAIITGHHHANNHFVGGKITRVKNSKNLVHFMIETLVVVVKNGYLEKTLSKKASSLATTSLQLSPGSKKSWRRWRRMMPEKYDIPRGHKELAKRRKRNKMAARNRRINRGRRR